MLPFGKDVRRVAVIGPAADNVYAQLGDYSPPQQPDETTTILAGIRRLLGPSVEVDYALGCSHRGDDGSGIADAVAMADRADAVVVAVGGSSNRYVGTKYLATGAADVASGTREMDCGEGVDLASLELGGRQRELVQALQATGRPLAVVLIQGRPHAIPWIAEHCPAILCAWYPGQQGGLAVAETLFGDANPSGRLAISIPRTVSQLPAYYNHKRRGEATYYDMPGSAQFPFGFGLSYTRFELSNLQLSTSDASAESLNAGGVVTATVDVANIGERAGAETVQLYLHGRVSSITRRVRELKAFAKVELEPGAARSITLTLDRDALAVWNSDMHFDVEAGSQEVLVQSGDGATLKAMLNIH